jgi:hypothetical protein
VAEVFFILMWPSGGSSLALKNHILPGFASKWRNRRTAYEDTEGLGGPMLWSSWLPASQELGEQRAGLRNELSVSADRKVKQWVGSVFS